MEELKKSTEEFLEKVREADCEQLRMFTHESCQYIIRHLDGLGVIDEANMKQIILLVHNQIYYENILIDLISQYRGQK